MQLKNKKTKKVQLFIWYISSTNANFELFIGKVKSMKPIPTKPVRQFILPFSFFLLLTICNLNGSTIDNALFPGKNIRINPEFKISRTSNGKIIVTSLNNPKTEVKHEFSDLYADLLLATYRKQSLDNIAENLRKKYYMSKDECRREIKHAINVLTEWKIIIQEDQIAQKH